MALYKAKLISEDVTTFERFLKFPFKKIQTKVSVKYDLSPEYVQQIFDKIDSLYIKLILLRYIPSMDSCIFQVHVSFI